MIRTRIGNLVYKAKSYTPTTGSKPAASDLAQKFVYWLERHPQYMKAHVIVPVPPSNKAKAFDLPAFVAKYLRLNWIWRWLPALRHGPRYLKRKLEMICRRLKPMSRAASLSRMTS